jgi:hypothetical protein
VLTFIEVGLSATATPETVPLALNDEAGGTIFAFRGRHWGSVNGVVSE